MNADTRIFGIINKEDETISCEIKGLAVREKEIVVSHVQFSEGWLEQKAEEDNTSSVLETISFHPEQELTQTDIKEFFETETDKDNFNWEVKNLLTGEVILEADSAE